jgi:TolA-binding protein
MGTKTMLGRKWMASACLLAAVLGITSLTFAQQPADGQQAPASQEAPAATPAPADSDLVNQVQQLQAEVDQLKAQIAQLNAIVERLQSDQPTPPAAPTAEKPSPKKGATKKASSSPASKPSSLPVAPVAEELAPTTVLVFHDGHRTEARNYAIVGQTLWIYTQDESQKVPLSELDVPATKNANSDRGIIFQMPPSH